jgi:hypothetical protein
MDHFHHISTKLCLYKLFKTRLNVILPYFLIFFSLSSSFRAFLATFSHFHSFLTRLHVILEHFRHISVNIDNIKSIFNVIRTNFNNFVSLQLVSNVLFVLEEFLDQRI